MKTTTFCRKYKILLAIGFLASSICFGQVGINTTNPDPNALLDVNSTILQPGGLLLPRMALVATNDFAPLLAHVAGMVVYNTAIAGIAPNNVTPGYYYNDGGQWVRIAAATPVVNDKWNLLGNAGTVSTTNFLGTTDGIALRFRTRNFDRFEITDGTTQANGGRLRAFTNGDAATPIYSWAANPSTGMFQQAANALGFSTNGTERFRIPSANQVHAMANGTLALPFYTWVNNTNIGMYRIGPNTLGFSALQVSVNGAPPFVGDRFTVNGAASESVINGYANGAAGTGVWGENITNGGTGILGTAPVGNGVIGENSAGVGNGVFGNSTNIGVRGLGGNGGLFEGGADNGFGAIAWNTTLTGVNRVGLIAIGQNLLPFNFADTGAILYGAASGSSSFANNANGTGLLAIGNNSLVVASLIGGSGLAATGLNIGVYGYATSTVDLPDATIGKAGGYFASAAGGFAYVSAWFDEPDAINGADVNYKIVGTGAVSTIVNDINNKPVTMFAPEAPEILFQDYGTGNLINGSAIIKLDPTLSKNIRVDAAHPLKVFVQLEGDCNGVYVTQKTAEGFTVKELQNGNSNVPFSWSVVATRADEVFQLKNGGTKTSHNSQRFPTAPSAIKFEENTKSQVNSLDVVIPLQSKTNSKSRSEKNVSQADTKTQPETLNQVSGNK